jgi:DNA-binding NarL/FixJ family response regulator
MQPRDRLTAKEIQVATLVWQGLTNKDIEELPGTTFVLTRLEPASR